MTANGRKGTVGVEEISCHWQLEQCTAHLANGILSSLSSLITRHGVCFILCLRSTGPDVRLLKLTYNYKLNTK
jgi:hypothetical protein